MHQSKHPNLMTGRRALAAAIALVCLGGTSGADIPEDLASYQIDDMLEVSCELPGRVRRVGRYATVYVPGPRKRLTALDCGIRGGKFDVFNAANYESALKIWQQKAGAGDIRAQNFLGEMYERGLGTDVDYKTAHAWYSKAAEAGHAAAQTNLGSLYERGLGVAQDQAIALEWYRKASGLATLEPAPELILETPAAADNQPVIHLIEPPAPATRGVAVVPVAAGVSVRQIVGRIDAPAGLSLLTINDASVEVDDNNLFRRDIPVPSAGASLTIVAVDTDGRRSERSLDLMPETATPAAAPVADFGRYHALVIGSNDYEELADLRTAVADAKRVASVLREVYGFEVTMLENADRKTILDQLNTLNNQLTSNDNLLIYYAGHGSLDEVNSRGYWLPVDAEPDSNTNWIPEIVITDLLRIMSVRHVLVVADSCYSGSLTRSTQTALRAGRTEGEQEAYYRSILGSRSRTALTSGGLAPVLDGGNGGHSVFAGAFIEILESNESILEGQRLFLQLVARVAAAAEDRNHEQVPQYAPIKFSGHESGDFLLVPRRANASTAEPTGAPVAALDERDLTDPNGSPP